MKTIGELRPDSVRGPSSAQRPGSAMGGGQERERIPRHHGPQAHRRNLQRRSGGGISLEGFGAERRRNSPVGARWRRQRPAALVHQVRGTLRDRRWLPVVERSYDWHFRNERYLRNEEPMARVAMVYSQQTARYYGGDAGAAKVEDHTLGYYHALIEARIPFEMVTTACSTQSISSRFKALILPNIAALSEGAVPPDSRVCRARGRARRHPRNLALRRVGRAPRRISDWRICLARHSGGRTDMRIDARMQNSYLRLEDDTGHRHPTLAGLDDADRIINGVSRVHTRPSRPTRIRRSR